jgi:hypothetical protein
VNFEKAIDSITENIIKSVKQNIKKPLLDLLKSLSKPQDNKKHEKTSIEKGNVSTPYTSSVIYTRTFLIRAHKKANGQPHEIGFHRTGKKNKVTDRQEKTD